MILQTVTIEKMAFGGAGIGHIGGKVCFVPFSAPGDVCTIRIKSEKNSYMEGELNEMLSPSELRVIPPCSVFGDCGGCNWQHIPYDVQKKQKQEIFSDLLWRSGKAERSWILPIIPAPDPYGYRTRMQFKLRYIAGIMHIGLYRSGTHYVVDIPDVCQIAREPINLLLKTLAEVISGFPEPDKLPQIDVTVGEKDGTALIFHYTGDKKEEITRYIKEATCEYQSTTVSLQSGRKDSLERISGDEYLIYSIPDLHDTKSETINMTFTPGGFSQVNYPQNQAIIKTVSRWANLSGTEKILDIFCGNGNFSIPLANKAGSVTGFEGYAPSISDAERNCRLNGVTNALFRCCDAVV